MHMSKARWKTSNTAVYNLGYHFIWCPKYRRPVLTNAIAKRLEELIHEKALELGCEVEGLDILPNHVHLFIKATPNHAPQYIVGQIKGYSSRILRLEFPSLVSRLPALWTRSYYVESVGHISEATIKKYIEDQKGK